MIRLKLLISTLILTFAIVAFAQQAESEIGEFDTSVKIMGRYVENQGIELRLFPQNKALLNAGLNSGFILERATGESNNFEEIARINPWSQNQWNEALSMEDETSETYSIIELAMDFLAASSEPMGGTFDFDQGVGDLKQQKSDEDFEYMVFMLTALREAVAAQGLALAFTDKDVVAGETYTYRASSINQPDIYRVVPEPHTIMASAGSIDYSHEVFHYEDDEEISFVWEDHNFLFGFDVERRAPGENTFTKLNDAPIFSLRHKKSDEPLRHGYNDKELENYVTYSYRFYGQNVFGERIMFAEVEAMPRDRTPPEQPRMTKLEHVAPREVLIEWEMNTPPASDLMAFIVARANSHDGEFTLIHPDPLPMETRSVTDTTFIEGQSNYYIIQAVDTAFNISTSLPSAVTLIDTIPPAISVWLSGEIDSLGVVRLEVERNTERDLMGYRLFRANDPEHEFSVIFEGFVDDDSLQHQIPTVFNDTVTLNSLTPRIYYKIVALDFNFNQSAYSETMVIERPDTIPPTTPVFKRVINRTNEIELHFALSESRDVENQQLFRNTSVEEPWVFYAELESDQTSFTDSDVEQGTTYYYSLQARDFSGNQSEFAHPVIGKAYDDGVRPKVENLIVEELDGMLTLSWDYMHDFEGALFAIYKTNANGSLVYHRRTSDMEFSERLPQQTISYAIKVFTADGGESLLSDEVVFVVE
jgi:fibronectin type 3 domain-containing protein